MDPRKEALSLKEFPLPVEEVEIAPTSIAILDNSIENLEKEISKLNTRLRSGRRKPTPLGVG